MIRRKTLKEVIEMLGIWGVLVTVPFLIPEIKFPLNVQLGILTTAGMAIAAIVYFLVLADQAILDLKPLPHYQGYRLPPSMDDARRFQEAYKKSPQGGSFEGPSENVTHPEAKSLKASQCIAKYVFDPDTLAIENAFIAKFGVIQVHSLSGTVKNCKVEARYRTLEEGGKTINDQWNEGGSLNWYSGELSDKIRNRPNRRDRQTRSCSWHKQVLTQIRRNNHKRRPQRLTRFLYD